MEATRYIGVRIPQDTYDALVDMQKSREEQPTLSAVVRGILRQYIRSKKKNGRKR
jgi:hypothetical protein